MRYLTLICAAAASVLFAVPVLAGPIDGTFSYQGRLTNSGALVTGTADVRFSLWDDDVAGAQVGATIDVLGAPVTDGLFNADLDFGVAALSGDERWLQIEVRSPAGVGGYTTLTPRQPILGAPYSVQTRGIFVDDALNVGIGTTTPGADLHVVGPTASLIVEASLPGDSVILDGSGDDFGVFADPAPLRHTFNGAMVQELVRASEGGQYHTFNIVTGQITGAIGTAQDSLSGFMQLFDGVGGVLTPTVSMYADKDLDRTNGVSEGEIRVRSFGTGGTGGEVSVQNNDGDKTIELLGGGSSQAGTLSMFDQTTGTATVTLQGDAFAKGGRIATWSEDGFQQFEVEPDGTGEGAFVTMKRTNGSNGFTFDGNDLGTGDAQLTISGASRSVNIQTRLSGNSSVALPTDAISSFEILDEPGVASSAEGISIFTFTGPIETILSRTITVPAGGYCFVIGTGQANAFHTTGATSQAIFGVSDTAGSFPVNQDVGVEIDSGAPSGFSSTPVTVQGLFSVAAGANTFYFLGDEVQGSWDMFDMQLSVMYFPTAYGTVTPTVLARNGNDNEATAPSVWPMTADDIYAEQMEGAAFDRNRRDAELDDYRREMIELRARLEEVERQQCSGDRAPRRASPPIEGAGVETGVILGHDTNQSR